MKTELDTLKHLFSVNKLSLNVNKTKYIFGNRKNNMKVQIMIDNIKIERVCENKFLVVFTDHKLCWKPHVDYIKNKNIKVRCNIV